ncbi:MAG: helix-turn-helix domain-containing protein [Gemmatimonadales bacterium]|nr:MAG: helix-turn-helix domain-containing protein [Gemmatimonadales bacterium]
MANVELGAPTPKSLIETSQLYTLSSQHYVRGVNIPVLTSLRALRVRLGWSQAHAGERANISRQAYAAIESGRSVPSTEVALRLSDAMGVTVEELFQLRETRTPAREVEDAGLGGPPAGRIRLARISGHERAFMLGPGTTHAPTPADGMGERLQGNRMRVRLFPDRPPSPELVVAGCDPAFGLVAERMRRRHGIEILWLKAGSHAALDALARGAVHVAGVHLRDPSSGIYNEPWIRRIVPFPTARIRFAEWEQVLVLEPGNPHRIDDLAQLAGSKLRFLNRAPGTGSRTLIEAVLARAGIPGSTIPGFHETVADGHETVGAAVASGAASAGVAIRAVADARGLSRIPLTREPYDLVIAEHFLELPAVQALLAVLRTPGLQREIESLGGYDASRMGLPA